MIERIDPKLRVGERETLNQYLDYGRATVVKIVTGLTKEQLATTVGASDLTLAGLIKHLALVEDAWFVETFLGEPIPEPWTPIDWDAAMRAYNSAQWTAAREHTKASGAKVLRTWVREQISII